MQKPRPLFVYVTKIHWMDLSVSIESLSVLNLFLRITEMIVRFSVIPIVIVQSTNQRHSSSVVYLLQKLGR